MDDHGKKIHEGTIHEGNGVDSRAVMDHCAAQTQITRSFQGLKKETG